MVWPVSVSGFVLCSSSRHLEEMPSPTAGTVTSACEYCRGGLAPLTRGAHYVSADDGRVPGGPRWGITKRSWAVCSVKRGLGVERGHWDVAQS